MIRKILHLMASKGRAHSDAEDMGPQAMDSMESKAQKEPPAEPQSVAQMCAHDHTGEKVQSWLKGLKTTSEQ